MELIFKEQQIKFDKTPSSSEDVIMKINDLLQDNYYFSHFIVDGLEVFDEHEDYLNINMDRIEKLEVIAKTEKEFMNDILLSAEDYLQRAKPELAVLTEAFYASPTTETHTSFGELMDGLQWLDEMLVLIINSNERPPNAEMYVELAQSLQGEIVQLGEAIENADNVLTADIIQYELTPIFDQFEALIGTSIDTVGLVMILVDNRNVLRVKDRDLLNQLTTLEKNEPTGNVIVEQAKTGVLTMKIVIDGRNQYIHSKYDPEKDAERLVSKYEEETYKHVLFVGTGLGYHIKKFTEAHPDAKFSIYEPDEEVLLTYLKHEKLDALPIQNLMHIFTGTDFDNIQNKMYQLLQTSKGMLQIITLPIYDRIYDKQIETIMKTTLAVLKNKGNSLVTDFTFQQRWTLNSIKNFPVVLKTPNILHDIDESRFKGKPAIIVAAGPALNEEFENLRYIKEHGLAYIFSVGSAINALIEHGIYPDAACTYDPTERNQLVIQRIKDENIREIPLIFGSSVGFETLEDYPGKMLHMITSQDTIAPQLLETKQAIDVVVDAPSIAVVTFQLLAKLQCSPIILVGQNLGFQDNKRYAAGIDYDFVEKELSEEEQKSVITVKDVYGNSMLTDEGFNNMRLQLELHIRLNGKKEIINTTKGGAQIEGTVFCPLSELISEKLTAHVVNQEWMDKSNSYDMEVTRNKLRLILLFGKECRETLDSSFDQLKKINMALQLRQSKNMEKRFNDFDKEFNKLKQNIFYKSYLEPMVRVQYNILAEESQRIRFEKDGLKKAEVIVNIFTSYLVSVFKQLEFVKPYIDEMKEQIENGWENDV